MNHDDIKIEIGDAIDRHCPLMKDAARVSMLNHVMEFMHDYEVAYGDAVAFIEDEHEGVVSHLLEIWDNEEKKWIPFELSDVLGLGNMIDYDCLENFSVFSGMYENWGESCRADFVCGDWDSRLGVWEALPTKPDQVVYGKSEVKEVKSSYGTHTEGSDTLGWYRIRIVPVGPFSKKAKKWMYENINCFKGLYELR